MVGAAIFGKDPLELIRVFLTVPMGESALKSESDVTVVIGVILYIVTGSIIGIIFEVVMAKYFKDASKAKKLVVAVCLGLAVWIVNFYCILSWLQPLLFGGSWILDMIPWWVAALTHIVFGLTMLLIGEWGHFEATDYNGTISNRTVRYDLPRRRGHLFCVQFYLERLGTVDLDEQGPDKIA
jgi:hypothetical protein